MSYFEEDQIELSLRKQVYPYEYLDSKAKFEEGQLPPISNFYSTLSRESISNEDYAHAQTVWKEFNLENLGQYYDLYVLTDVLALTDVFENFQNTCLNYYGLDAAHFYTSLGLAWQVALEMTGVRLKLLIDIDMHLFIENGLRRGISMISHRHTEVNHIDVPDHDPYQPNCHVMYLATNNLYGWAMSHALPVDDFRWLNEDEITDLNINEITDDEDNGYILIYFSRLSERAT